MSLDLQDNPNPNPQTEPVTTLTLNNFSPHTWESNDTGRDPLPQGSTETEEH